MKTTQRTDIRPEDQKRGFGGVWTLEAGISEEVGKKSVSEACSWKLRWKHIGLSK